MPESMASVAWITLGFLLAGGVKGILGMGLPTVAVGLLSLSMPPAQAAALVIAPALFTNIWQSVAGPDFWGLMRRLWPLLVCVCLGIWAGAGVITGDTKGHAAIGLGLCLMLYAVVGLTAVHFRVPPRAEGWLAPLIGIMTGLVTGATGVFVIPAVPYLQALQIDRDRLIQALGMAFVTATLMLGVVLAQAGIFRGAVAGASLAAVAPAFIGMMLGQGVRGRIPPTVFRTCFFAGMLVLGAHLASRAIL
jgi:uncharacterized membrane protein YfcA